MRAIEERFWPKVDKGASDGCWEWAGSRSTSGYGNLRDGQRVIYAHRFSFELANGAIPEGLVIDHLCRNRACVNPGHLEAVSRAENNVRGLKTYALRDTCKRGHDITRTENVYVRPSGHRQCRVCLAVLAAERRHAKRCAA